MFRPIALIAAVLIAGTAAAQDIYQPRPIPVHMARGTDTIRLNGALRRGGDCCTYVFKAHAGQTLVWRFSGPAARMVIVYPNGDADGPGIPSRIHLPEDGAYQFRVSPNLMADGAFGRFTLTLTILPLPRPRGYEGHQ